VDFVIYILSIWALVGGTNIIIINSELLSIKFNAPNLLIVAILMVFGISIPEITNSVFANLHNKPAISIANLIGSNIFTITVILPIIILLSKGSSIKEKESIEDVSWIFLVTIIFLLVSLDGKIEFIESIFLIISALFYMFIVSSRDINYDSIHILNSSFEIIKSILLALLGLIFILVGSYFAVESAVSIGNNFNISDWKMGLIFIAISTSIPKLIIILSFLLKNRPKVAISTTLSAIVSNMTLGVGLSGIVKDIFIFESNIFDILMLPFLSLVLLVCISNRVYTKPIAFIFIGLYILFFIKHST